MATGRIDVSRVRGVHGGGLSSGRVRDVHRVGWKRGAHVVADDFEDGEILQVDGEFQLPPEKKRKYSPIIWDKEEKKGELLKDGLVKASLPCLPDWGLVKESVVEGCGAALESPLVFASSDQASQGSVVDEEQGPEGEELVEPRNVYMSRWAFDEDDVPGDTEEVLHGSGSRSMESDCRDSSVSFSSADETSESKLDSQASMADDEYNVSTGFPHRSVGMCQGCRSVFEYERLNEIGEGTYGKVYRARDKKTGEIVALKKVKISANLEKYDTPLTALREINILSSLYHPNIVNIKEVVMDDLDSVFIVMECMDNDLKGVMEVMKQPFHTSDVKWLMRQILKGVKHLHNNWVLHRDLKTSNILLNNNGELKLCDFGMSRRYGDPLKPYTPLVVTLWYRAPELLLGAKKYSTAVDMWSVGCIMAELLAKKPLFSGKNEIDQLDKIFRLLSTPNEETWPGFAALPGAKAKFDRKPYLLDKMFSVPSFTGKPVLSGLGLDLLNKLLAYDSEKRITADDALNHPWFHEEPKAKKFLPTFPPQSARARIRHATKRSWILRHAWLRQMCTIVRYYLFNLVKQIGADGGTKILVMILSSLCRRF